MSGLLSISTAFLLRFYNNKNSRKVNISNISVLDTLDTSYSGTFYPLEMKNSTLFKCRLNYIYITYSLCVLVKNIEKGTGRIQFP